MGEGSMKLCFWEDGNQYFVEGIPEAIRILDWKLEQIASLKQKMIDVPITAQMALGQDDLRLRNAEPIFPGPTEPLKLNLEDLSERLDATQRNLEYTARKLNQLEEDMKHMECHNEVQAKWVSELRCLHADEIRKWSDELSDIEQK